jgi:hypothetical protein
VSKNILVIFESDQRVEMLGTNSISRSCKGYIDDYKKKYWSVPNDFLSMQPHGTYSEAGFYS